MKISKTHRRVRHAHAVEPLECRIAPASIVSVTGGNLSDIDNVSGDDNITLSFSASTFHFFDPNGIVAGTGAVQVDPSHVDVDQATVTGSVTIDTSTGNDVVKLSAGLPPLAALMVHTQALSPLPDLTITAGPLDVTATAGDIAVMGQVTAGSVIFHAAASISTLATGGIAAGNLDLHAGTGIVVNFTATTLSAANANAGGIFLNTSAAVTLTALDPGTGGATLNNGTFSLSSNNAFVGAPDLTVNGILDLAGFNATIGALSGSGTVTNSAAVQSMLVVGQDGASATFPGAIGGFIAVVKAGAGTETFSGQQSYPFLTTNAGVMNLLTPLTNATIVNNGGMLNLAGGDTGSSVDVEAATNFNGSESLASLHIGTNGFAKLAPHPGGANTFVLSTAALTFANASSGQLDLTNNAMIVRGGDLAAITAQLAGGLATSTGGYWNGPGINSSSAASDPAQITALGVADNSYFGYSSFLGQPLPNTEHDVLIRFTYYGDADLNGVVNGVDYGLSAQGFNTGGSGWSNGDFDYDGTVTAADLAKRDMADAQQAGGPGTVIHEWTGGGGSNDWFDAGNWTNGVPGAADTAVLATGSGPQPQLNTTATVAFWDQITGTLTGTGTLNVTQGMTWLGGLEGGAGGATVLAPSASLTIGGGSSQFLDARLLTLPSNTTGSISNSFSVDSGATLQALGPLTLAINLDLFGSGLVFDTNGFDVTLDATGAIEGGGQISKIGAGTLHLDGANTYSGTTNVLAGVLTADAANKLSPAGTIVVNGGTLDIGAFDQTLDGLQITAGNIGGTTGKIVTFNPMQLNGGTVSVDLISGSSIDINSATVNANLDAGPAGTITLDAGAWTVKSSNATTSGLVVHGGLLKLGAFTETAGSLTVTGGTIASTNGTIHTTGGMVISNAAVTANLVGEGGITVFGGTVNGNVDAFDNPLLLLGGTVTYTSTITTSSGLTVNGGNLVLGAASPVFHDVTIDTGTVTATSGVLTSANAMDINGGTINANIDAGANPITVVGGTITPNTSLNIASDLVMSGGTLVLGKNNASLGGLTFGGGSITGTGIITSATDYVLQGGTLGMKLAGNVGVTVGPGAAVLTNSKNTFTGTVTIASGSLQIASDGALGNAANVVDIESGGTLITAASITSARHIVANGATPVIDVTTGTVTLNGVIDGTGALLKIGPGNLLFGNLFIGTTTLSGGGGTISVGGDKVHVTGAGNITLTVVSNGMGGTRISTVALSGTDATTVLAINGPKAPATTTIDTIQSLDPNDEIGTIKLGPTVILGNGVDDAIPDVNIAGKVDRMLLNDIGAYTLFDLGKGLPYNNPADDTTPDSYNNHPDLKLRNVLGPGVIIDVTGNGIAGDQPGSIGGGGLGKVVVNSWTQPGLVETSQSIGSFQFKHGDCNVVFLVDPNHLGALTVAGIGKMLVPNGAWGSSGSIVEGNVTVFSAAQFLAAANITAGSMTKLLVKKGPYLGTTTLKDPDAAALGTFSVNGDYQGYIDSAQPIRNVNIKGDFKGALKAASIGSISAYAFDGTVATDDDPVGDPARYNIYVTDGALGTIKTSAGGIQNFEIAVATVFNGFSINWPGAPSGAVGIDNVTVAAGQINNLTVNLNAGVADPLSLGIENSVFESASSIGNVTSSHTVSGATLAAATTMGNVVVKAALLDSKLLAGTSLGGDGIFNGNETYTRAGKIGNVTVAGEFATTSIAVGVDPGADYLYGDADDIAASGVATPKALGALVFGAASGGIFGPAGLVHTDAIEAATLKSLKIGIAPVLKTFVGTHYLRLGLAEAASDVLVRVL